MKKVDKLKQQLKQAKLNLKKFAHLGTNHTMNVTTQNSINNYLIEIKNINKKGAK